MRIHTENILQLLDSAEVEPHLVLYEGKVTVISAEDIRAGRYPEAFQIISRDDLNAQFGGAERVRQDAQKVADGLETQTTTIGG